MIEFLLNDKLVSTSMPPGMVMVDFIRYHKHLTGTKIGCREGDCGACTILVGETGAKDIIYNTVTSCLMPLANAHGKHIVTVEGINMKEPNKVQQVMCDEGATQCGFCTPGFVISLAGFCLKEKSTDDKYQDKKTAIAAVDGNICRCTGYKSIERAAMQMDILMNEKKDEDTVSFLIKNAVLPPYFSEVSSRLQSMKKSIAKQEVSAHLTVNAKGFLGGGTDLYVQQPEALLHRESSYMFDRSELKGISKQGNKCVMGASATVSDFVNSPIIQEHFPRITSFVELISSTPIRNMATIAGNFINASPIGDLSILFLALDAQLVLTDDLFTRELALQDLYKGYKSLDKSPVEYIQQISFSLPGKHTFFNFEKVSKRTHLDIASVNTALLITVENNIITNARLSAGGVGPIPLLLAHSSRFLTGKRLSVDTVQQVIEQALSEVSPISDIRGTVTYKRLLLKQLIKAHFVQLFPELQTQELLYI